MTTFAPFSEARILGSRIRYRDLDGSGTPLVFIHGGGLSLDYWEKILNGLEGRRRIALDLIGHGGSDKPDLSYDIECHRKYLLAFMDSLGIDRAFLVGHSYGGVIAAWVAAKSPERVVAPIIIQAPGIPGSMQSPWPKDLFLRPGPLNRILFTVTGTSIYRAMFPQKEHRQTLGLTNSIFNEDYTHALGQVTHPTLILMSRGDDRVRFSFKDDYLELVEHAEFHELPPEAGHMAPRRYPEGTAALIADFVSHHDPEETTGESRPDRG